MLRATTSAWLEALEEFGVATDVSQLEVLVLARARAYAIINKVTA